MKNQKLSLNQIKRNENKLKNCRTIKQVAVLLNTSQREITLQSFEPSYYHFKIPKKRKGEFRHIEAPSQELKHLQRKLNFYLQSVYYLNQSKASYGYIIKAIGQKNNKNIYTNALQHLGNNYMLNVDFKDFFHQISLLNVTKIFKSSLFNFDNNTAYTLAKICTYNARLPMGAPTSPALSNLYAIALDHELNKWATINNITFTRFVDDLSFSAKNKPITTTHFEQINKIALKYHLNFNTKKPLILIRPIKK
jgi:RNA-directed DNA polymerase